jgi:hypothetical protein
VAGAVIEAIDWVVDKLTVDHWSIADIKAVLVYS